MVEEIPFAEVEELLLRAEFGDCRPLSYSANYVFLATMCAGDEARFAAVYKPHRGESPLWDFPAGELYKREAAAYRLSRLLDWPMVPPTVVRDGPEGVGSLQLYIRHDPEVHFFVQRESDALARQLKRICVFDIVTNNADRKGGHFLLDGNGRIWGIDHGLCFHPAYKLRSVAWDWVGEPIDAELLADIERAAESLESGAEEAKPLLGLLHTGEPEALVKRMRQLLSSGTFPRPGAERHYPWPLV